ncbi:GSCOCG00004006001-RA-CDS [Cotesia congregata]|nr:GSCOCG00004006001-RA-CDS [Cotesia congregata]
MHSSSNIGPDYISLNINDFDINSRITSKSLWRQWNQLSRFQRNIFYILFGTLKELLT